MRKILLLVAVLGLSACGKKADEPKGDCTASVANAVNLSAEEFKKNGVTEATVEKIRESSVVRCKEDKWTNEVLKCLADAKKADDVAKCQQMMSKEQSDNMAKAIAGAMGTQPDQGSGSETPDQGSAGSGSGSEGSGSAAEAPVGLPPECAEYKTLVDKLATCEKLPQASRDMLKKTFDDTSKTWVNIDKLPADAKAALVGGCKQGADALKQSAGAACGF
jgi:hypothetical protein